MAKTIIYEGRETTISELAKEHGVSYMTMYMRLRAAKKNKPDRRKLRRAVEWRDKDGTLHHFESLAALARFLGCSREWARRLIDARDKEEKE